MYDINNNIVMELKEISISWEAIIDEDILWLTSVTDNAIFKINIRSLECLDVFFFPEEKSTFDMSVSFVKNGKYIYFAPYNMNEFWRFDIVENKFEAIEIGIEDHEKEMLKKFPHIINHNDKLYLFGDSIRKLVIFDTKTGDYYVDDDYQNVLNELIECKELLLLNERCCDEFGVYIPIRNSCYSIYYDYNAEKFELVKLLKDDSAVCAISKVQGNRNVVSDNCGNLIIIDKEKRESYLIGKCKLSPVKKIIYNLEDEYILIPHLYNRWEIISNTNINNLKFDFGDDSTLKEGVNQFFMFVLEFEGKVYAQLSNNGDIYKYSIDSGIIEKCEIIFKNEICNKIREQHKKYRVNIINETSLYSLNYFLSSI